MPIRKKIRDTSGYQIQVPEAEQVIEILGGEIGHVLG